MNELTKYSKSLLLLLESLGKLTLLGVVLLATSLRELTKRVLLLLGQPSGDLHVDGEDQIASAVVPIVDVGNALTSQSKDGAGLGALLDLVLDGALQSGDVDLGAQRGLGDGDGYLAVDVHAVPLENAVGADGHLNDQISRRTAVLALAALTPQSDALAVVDSGGAAMPSSSPRHTASERARSL